MKNKIWLNGKIIDWDKASTHILTHGLHYGSGVFEGIRFYRTDKGPAIFRLNDHVARLFNSAKSLNIKIPYTQKEIKEVIIKIIKLNKIQEGYIRPIAFYGPGKMGLDPKGASVWTAVAVWPWGKYLSKESVAVKISSFIRPHPQSIVNQAKVCGYYVNSIFATIKAKKEGYDEALLLDYQGNVAEGPGENIFFVKNKILYTPEKGNILLGLTRDSIIKIARDLNIKVKEKKIKKEEIKKADEAFFCGTAVEICSINRIDEKKIKGQAITNQIKDVFERAIKGKEKRYLSWLTRI